MLNLSLAVCEAITPNKNSPVKQATMGVHKKYIKLKA